MRLRRAVPAAACAAAGVLASLAVPAAHAAGPVPSRPDPCTVSYAAPKDDAPVYYAAPSDPDLDVTHVTWRVGPADVVVTAEVASLADRPAAAWGDEFDAVVTDRTTGHTATFGYFRSPTGGGPVLNGSRVPAAQSPAGTAWSAYPGGVTHLLAAFDRQASRVVLTIPRTDLDAAFGVRSGKLVLTGLGVNTYAMAPNYEGVMADFGLAALDPKAWFLSFGACDRWLAKRHVRPPAASPCRVDVVAATGDETSRTSDAAPTRDDSLDVARVTYRLDAKNLVVTIRVSRLTDRPVVGTGQGWSATFLYRDRLADLGVTRDAVYGVRTEQYAGQPVPSGLKASIDAARNQVVLTLPRAVVAAAFGLRDTRTLTLASLGATAFWTAGGETFSTADTASTGRALSFAACDKALRKG